MEENNNNETEIIEHKVEIDNYLSVTLKIPKILSAIELKALMVKANKMFNLSETPLVEKRKYRTRLGNEDRKALAEKYNKSSKEEKQRMAQEMGVSDKTLYQRIWGINKDFNISTEKKNTRPKKYSDEFVNNIISKLREGKLTKDIADEVGISRKTIYDLILQRTGKTPKTFKSEGKI